MSPSLLLLLPLLLTITSILITSSCEAKPLYYSSFNGYNISSFTSTSTSTLPPLRVHGNRFVQLQPDGSATTFIPHGVNSVGALWFCLGGYGIFDHEPTVQMLQSMKGWSKGMNIVRMSMNEDCWLNINSEPKQAPYVGEPYQAAIEKYLNMLIDNGFYAIIELHWTAPGTERSVSQMPMPDADHAPHFWRSVAKRFGKYSDHVIFDVFNEPFPQNNAVDSTAAWECWQMGGYACSLLNYSAAGMQSLVDSVRSTGAQNIILLGGINYANSLVQWVKYKPNDPLNQLVAAWHSYSKNYCVTEECWKTNVLPVLKSVPVLASEIGENDCTVEYILPLMKWLKKNDIGFLSWVWDTYSDCKAGPSLVTDVDTGNCTESYGCGYKQFVNENFNF